MSSESQRFPLKKIGEVINVSAQMTRFIDNFELLLIYNFTVNKYRLACKENKPKVLLGLEKQIRGRNPATFTVLCRSLSTSLVNCCQQAEIADTSKTT